MIPIKWTVLIAWLNARIMNHKRGSHPKGGHLAIIIVIIIKMKHEKRRQRFLLYSTLALGSKICYVNCTASLPRWRFLLSVTSTG